MSPVRQALRSQRLTVLYAVIVCLAFLVGAQWVLLAITIEGFQGGQRDLLIPSAAASGLCCAAALALMWSATSARTEN
jgi:hypothetical protein